MASIIDISYRIIQKYPYKDELSNARLTKMIYLADWHHCLKNGFQISEINWYFDNFGPFVWDVYNEISKRSDLFGIKVTTNYFGKEKKLIFAKESMVPFLVESEIYSIDKIIDKTKSLYWDKFINLVYSTFPIRTTEKYSHIDLIKKATEFKKNKEKSGHHLH